jgi:hypothetical protein
MAGMSWPEKIRFCVRRIVSRRATDERSAVGRAIAASFAPSSVEMRTIALRSAARSAFDAGAGSFRTCAFADAQTALAAVAQPPAAPEPWGVESATTRVRTTRPE